MDMQRCGEPFGAQPRPQPSMIARSYSPVSPCDWLIIRITRKASALPRLLFSPRFWARPGFFFLLSSLARDRCLSYVDADTRLSAVATGR